MGLWKTAETRNTEVLNFLESENITNEIRYYETYQRTIYLDAGGAHTGRASLTRWIAENPVPAILSACVLALQAKSEFLSHMSYIAKPVSVKDIENALMEIED